MKKIIALILAVTMVTAMLAGCGSSEKSKTDSNAKNQDQTSKADTSPLKFKATTVNFGELPTGKAIQDEWLKRCSESLGREIDIEFEYINIADYKEKLKILMAGGDLSDVTTIFGMDNSDVLKYGQQGIVEELTQHSDIMPNYSKILKDSEDVEKIAYSTDKKVYGFYNAVYMDQPEGNLSTCAAVRKDILDKNKLTLPKTQDEFYNVAKALKAADPDVYPIILHEEWMNAEEILFSGNHTSSDRYYNGKKFVYGPVEDAYKEALMTMKKWYAESLIAPDYFAHTSTEGMASVSNGKAYMIANIYQEYPGLWKKEFSDQEWVLIPGLENSKYGKPWTRTQGQKGNVKLSNGSSVIVSSKSKVKEDIIKFMDMQFSDKVVEVLTWGIEDKSFKRDADGKRTLLPEFIGGESSDGLIGMALPASGRCRAGIFPTPQNMNMNWDNLNPSCKIFDGTKIVDMSNSTFARENPGEIHPNTAAPLITLSVDENEEYANIMTAVNTYAKEAKVKFIKGETSFDKWDSYVKEINAMGDINKALDIYNSKQ